MTVRECPTTSSQGIKHFLVDKHCREGDEASTERLSDGLQIWSSEPFFLFPGMHGPRLTHSADDLDELAPSMSAFADIAAPKDDVMSTGV